MSDRRAPAHVAADPEWEAHVRASFARQGAMALMGASIEHLAPGVCVVVAPYRPELSQQHGFFHAGITSALADSAGGYAALTLFPRAGDAAVCAVMQQTLMRVRSG